MKEIKIVDLFAGPGGLSEGFSAYRAGKKNIFKIRLSIEKDPYAHQTLELRAFYRQFKRNQAPKSYFDYITGRISRESLFDKYSEESERAKNEAQLLEIGVQNNKIRTIIKSIASQDPWIMIGGPPCQAYSLAGRSRNKGIKGYNAEKDRRHFLYEHYLRLVREFQPPVFVMENVSGILSSKVNGRNIFNLIISDLIAAGYKPYSLVKKPYAFLKTIPVFESKNYIIRCENYGIPQARHRVIILGVRSDINVNIPILSRQNRQFTLIEAIGDLSPIRSKISKPNGLRDNSWEYVFKSFPLKEIRGEVDVKLLSYIKRIIDARQYKDLAYSTNAVKRRSSQKRVSIEEEWFQHKNLSYYVNHESRSHMLPDLHRYLFASCFAELNGKSPHLKDFPDCLLPTHKNIEKKDKVIFSDRFRVQLKNTPSTTITSHISKDGHYYIHPDPNQCRSLTVREVARLQTFPDSYFFCGPRTSQYQQVGNAVPPLLARQIAHIVFNIIKNI